MVNNMLEELKKLNEAESLFDNELLEKIQWNELKDAYTIRACEYPALVITKSSSFESNYYLLIHYLTDINSQYRNKECNKAKKSYYNDWLVYRQSYNVRLAYCYLNVKDMNDKTALLECFITIVGQLNYHAVTNMLNMDTTDLEGQVQNIMEYVGNSRAIRNMGIKYFENHFEREGAFHIWNLYPYSIIKEYGNIFYLGNELDSLGNWCPYNYEPKQYYYNQFYKTVRKNCNMDMEDEEDTEDDDDKIELFDMSTEELLDLDDL